ncbi:MAG: hypothetical protein CFE28_01205 [Alphaproteobacteria bacterium PA2]|nr:MAG: hypothetical protein CFE28_01205 [Alphaproteobacteria bacterium PA2]
MTLPRTFSTLAIALTAAALSACAGYAVAEIDQPHMRTALADLQNVRAELAMATTNKGGHRVLALKHVDEAIREVRLGIANADGYVTPKPR